MKKSKLWIWESENYPNFVYDKKEIELLLLDIVKQQGILEGTIKHLSQNEQDTIFTENLLDEIIFNSSIEGEILQRSSVRTSLRKQFEKLDDNTSDKHTDNIVSIQQDVNENHQPLTEARLNYWHHALIINSNMMLHKSAPGYLEIMMTCM